ncbi:glycosyltransferase [Sulfuracidifex tepidarius]|nr:glycosyltransferase family 2 protein [Sulfuracidifex tepidarius]
MKLFSNVQVNGNFPLLSIIVPTKGEKIETILGLLDNVKNFKWDLSKIEIIIVSDDSEEFVNELRKAIAKENVQFNVNVFRRERKLGFKSGALSYGLERAHGELVITLDVDSRLDPESIYRAYMRMISAGCDAVSLKWIGYTSDNSILAKALLVSTKLGSLTMLLGRHAAGFNVFPVGSGTLYKKKCLDDVGGWDYRMIQDDLEIGTRLMSKGYKICASDSPIFVEVPNNFVSFFIQQTRWAMGTTEVLKNRFRYILFSKSSIAKKLETILYLSQYFPIAFTFITSIFLPFLPFFHVADPLFSPLFLLWIASVAVYSLIYIKIAEETNFSLFDSIRSLGKVSAYTVAISPFITISLIKGFMGKRTYVVTPKGKVSDPNKKYIKIISIIGTIGILFLTGGIFLIVSSYYLVGLWLLYYAAGYIFTAFSYVKELEC